MKRPIGATFPQQPFLFPGATKQAALMFEQIHSVKLLETLGQSRTIAGLEPVVAEVEWLFKNGIFVDNSIVPRESPRPMTEPHRELFQEYRQLKPLAKRLDELSQIEYFTYRFLEGDFIARAMALGLSERFAEVYPFSSIPSPPTVLTEAKKANVIQIVLNALPMPDDSVSWEQILEYRSDPESYSKFLALRNWITDISHSKLSSIEVEQKIEYLLSEYQSHMNLHKMKAKLGRLETVVLATAEFLEDLANRKFSKIAERLFSATKSKLELMEAEKGAPGKELSYVISARQKLQGVKL